jgi:hypothetical protein
MSNRFHSKYHRSNHHTDTNLNLSLTNPDGSPRNPDSGHDPIASPDHPFLGRFSLKGGLSAITSDTNPDKSAGIFIARNLNEDACRFYGPVKLSGSFIMQDNIINADINTHKVGINIEPSTYTGFDLIVNDSVYVLENTTTKTLNSNHVTIDTNASYGIPSFDVLNASNSNHFFTILSTGQVGVNLGATPDFESQDLKVIGYTLFDSQNKLFQIKGETQINHTSPLYTTKIGTNANAGRVSLGRNEIVRITTAPNLSAGCDFILCRNLYLSGDQDIKGNLTIQGNLSTLGTHTQLDTYVAVTSAVSITNAGTGPALTVTQTGSNDIVTVLDDSNVVFYIKDGGNVGVGTNNPLSRLTVYNPNYLATPINSTIDIASFGNYNGSTNNLKIYQKRFSTGNAWTNSETRIQQTTDVTDQTYISFSPDGGGGMAFGVGSPGVEKMRILGTNGNVGIGTTNPNEKLTVVGSISAAGNIYSNDIYLNRLNSLQEGGQIWFNRAKDNTPSFSIDVYSDVSGGTDSRLRFIDVMSPGGLERMTMLSGGNVGIGTSAPNEKLTVVGGISATGDISVNTGSRLNLATTSTEMSIYRDAGNNGMAFSNSNLTRMFIADGGNVGVGMTSPTEKLHVNGNILLNNANVIRARDTVGSSQDVLTCRWSDNATYLDGGTGGLYLRTNNGTNAIRIDNAQNIGIGGIATPSVRLDVNGDIKSSSNISAVGTISSSNISAVGTIGYTTGAGGAVTQLVSRTTAVTINKICGSITMFSAAGSTTWASFTANNNLVSSTDTILLSYSGGSNNYVINVGRIVNATSFVINFVSISGIVIDAPTINFTIIKSVKS